MNVKTTFLHGDLDKPIYMSQPEGFVDPKYPDHVCLLKKALCGLKQSPRRWNIKFDQCMQSMGFTRSVFDHCLYFKNLQFVPVFLLLYVDDMLIMSPSSVAVKSVQDMLSTNFDMKDLGHAQKILSIDIVRNMKKKERTLHQSSYMKKILSKFNMVGAKPSTVLLAAHFILSRD